MYKRQTIGTSISAVRLLKHGYLKGKMKMAIASAVCAMTGSVLGAKVSLLVSDSVIRHMMIVVLPIVAYHCLLYTSRESRVEMMPACSRFMKDTPFVDSRGHSRTRAAALCCLLT